MVQIHFQKCGVEGRAESTISLPTMLEILMVEKTTTKKQKSQKSRWDGRKDKFTSPKKKRGMKVLHISQGSQSSLTPS